MFNPKPKPRHVEKRSSGRPKLFLRSEKKLPILALSILKVHFKVSIHFDWSIFYSAELKSLNIFPMQGLEQRPSASKCY